METFSALLVFCEGNSPATGEFPTQRPVTVSFDIFYDLQVNISLSRWSRRRWLRRHGANCDVIVMLWKFSIALIYCCKSIIGQKRRQVTSMFNTSIEMYSFQIDLIHMYPIDLMRYRAWIGLKMQHWMCSPGRGHHMIVDSHVLFPEHICSGNRTWISTIIHASSYHDSACVDGVSLAWAGNDQIQMHDQGDNQFIRLIILFLLTSSQKFPGFVRYTVVALFSWHISDVIKVITQISIIARCKPSRLFLATRDLFFWHGSTLIPAWVSNYSHCKVCDEITYQLANFNEAAVEVWGWIHVRNFIIHFTGRVIAYSCWRGSAGAQAFDTIITNGRSTLMFISFVCLSFQMIEDIAKHTNTQNGLYLSGILAKVKVSGHANCLYTSSLLVFMMSWSFVQVQDLV